MTKKKNQPADNADNANQETPLLEGEVIDAPANNGMALVPTSQIPATALTQVVDEAVNLFTRDGWQVTDTSVAFPTDREVGVDEILSKAAFVGKMGRVARIWLGDIIRQTNHKYGEMYTRFAEVTGYTVDSLKQSVYAMAHVLPENRHANLTFYHLRLAADLPDAQQKRLLAMASDPPPAPGAVEETTEQATDSADAPKAVEAMPTEAFATLVKNVKKHGLEILDAPPQDAATGTAANLAAAFFRFVFRAREPKESVGDYQAARLAGFEETCKRYDDPRYKAKAEKQEAEAKSAERLVTLRTKTKADAEKVKDEKKRGKFITAIDKAKDADGVNAVKAQISTEVKAQENAAKLLTDYADLVKDLPATLVKGLDKMRDRGDKLSEIKGEIKKVKLVIAEAKKLATSEHEGIYAHYAGGKTVDAIRKIVKDAKKASDKSARENRQKKLEQAKHKDTAAASLRTAGDEETAKKVEQEARQLRFEADGGEGEVPENWKPALAKPGSAASVKKSTGKKGGKKR